MALNHDEKFENIWDGEVDQISSDVANNVSYELSQAVSGPRRGHFILTFLLIILVGGGLYWGTDLAYFSKADVTDAPAAAPVPAPAPAPAPLPPPAPVVEAPAPAPVVEVAPVVEAAPSVAEAPGESAVASSLEVPSPEGAVVSESPIPGDESQLSSEVLQPEGGVIVEGGSVYESAIIPDPPPMNVDVSLDTIGFNAGTQEAEAAQVEAQAQAEAEQILHEQQVLTEATNKVMTFYAEEEVLPQSEVDAIIKEEIEKYGGTNEYTKKRNEHSTEERVMERAQLENRELRLEMREKFMDRYFYDGSYEDEFRHLRDNVYYFKDYSFDKDDEKKLYAGIYGDSSEEGGKDFFTIVDQNIDYNEDDDITIVNVIFSDLIETAVFGADSIIIEDFDGYALSADAIFVTGREVLMVYRGEIEPHLLRLNRVLRRGYVFNPDDLQDEVNVLPLAPTRELSFDEVFASRKSLEDKVRENLGLEDAVAEEVVVEEPVVEVVESGEVLVEDVVEGDEVVVEGEEVVVEEGIEGEEVVVEEDLDEVVEGEEVIVEDVVDPVVVEEAVTEPESVPEPEMVIVPELAPVPEPAPELPPAPAPIEAAAEEVLAMAGLNPFVKTLLGFTFDSKDMYLIAYEDRYFDGFFVKGDNQRFGYASALLAMKEDSKSSLEDTKKKIYEEKEDELKGEIEDKIEELKKEREEKFEAFLKEKEEKLKEDLEQKVEKVVEKAEDLVKKVEKEAEKGLEEIQGFIDRGAVSVAIVAEIGGKSKIMALDKAMENVQDSYNRVENSIKQIKELEKVLKNALKDVDFEASKKVENELKKIQVAVPKAVKFAEKEVKKAENAANKVLKDAGKTAKEVLNKEEKVDDKPVKEDKKEKVKKEKKGDEVIEEVVEEEQIEQEEEEVAVDEEVVEEPEKISRKKKGPKKEYLLNGVFPFKKKNERYVELTTQVENSYEAIVTDDLVFNVPSISFGRVHDMIDQNSTISVEIGGADHLAGECAILVFGNDMEKDDDPTQFIEASGISLLSFSDSGLPVDQGVVDDFQTDKGNSFLGYVYFSDLEVVAGNYVVYLNLAADTPLERGRYTSMLSMELFCPAGGDVVLP